MQDKKQKHRDLVVAYIAAQFDALCKIGAPADFLKSFAEIVTELKDNNSPFKEKKGTKKVIKVENYEISEKNIFEVKSLSHDQIKTFISDEMTSRAFLEMIAVHKFGIPKGSVKGYRNKVILREKISQLNDNREGRDVIFKIAKTGAKNYQD
jgi:hypothetical protein